ncbi:D-aminoacyl-tRNA deacylase [bioreactor metagenome]|uniref:D-aminoacyl-tRNA deacylase n=1 Tax=bioreactor metagenome TaxID=1076179 RepID=A0A645CU87_9ZZZZ|nr:D-aminoacyl-tRNA deacylase [Lutispora sp.]MEA4963508.1 D-aminoacyl-tRNA deacylase [Lutispora sp.]HCJ57577.1 D-tyrosyl-tRNA(Tyr) deacylase [Clostridiaceae bacterium]
MRAVVQRVKISHVEVDGKITGQIGKGLMILLGISEDDKTEDIDYMVDKITNLRIFEDDENKMNLSLLDVKGELLVVSQFTLYGDCRKGRRPSFIKAARPEKAQQLYDLFIKKAEDLNVKVQSGVFQADMTVYIENDGPVTLIVDSEKII